MCSQKGGIEPEQESKVVSHPGHVAEEEDEQGSNSRLSGVRCPMSSRRVLVYAAYAAQ